MDSLQNIKGRKKAVQNISQITMAMEVVAATKMRRSQEVALASRMYGIASLDILRHLAKQSPEILASCRLFDKRVLKNTLVVIEASDQGLAAAFNAQVAKAVDQFFANDMMKGKTGHSYKIVLVGKKLSLSLLLSSFFCLTAFYRNYPYYTCSGIICCNNICPNVKRSGNSCRYCSHFFASDASFAFPTTIK